MTTGRPNRKHGTAHLPAAIAISVLLHLVVLGVLGLAGPGLFEYEADGAHRSVTVHTLGAGAAEVDAESGPERRAEEEPPADEQGADEQHADRQAERRSQSEADEVTEAPADQGPADDATKSAETAEAAESLAANDSVVVPSLRQRQRHEASEAREAPEIAELREAEPRPAGREPDDAAVPARRESLEPGRADRAGPAGPDSSVGSVDRVEEPAGDGRGEPAGVSRAELIRELYRELEEAFEYPRAAQRRGIEGTVVLLVWVSLEGELKALEVEEASGSRVLDEAAAETVAKLFPRSRAQQDAHRVRLRVSYALN